MLPRFYYPQAAEGGDVAYANKHGLWDDDSYVAQEKFDGARYIIHKDEQGDVRIYSRGLSKKTGEPVDKTSQLRHLADEFYHIAPSAP